jgi:multidrug efflux pump subunit AcrA (membrane-fusion protein)
MRAISLLNLLAVMLFGWSLVGCSASVPPPTQKMALSAAAINQAEASGAVEFAPVEMRSAREKLAQAQTAFSQEDNQRALQLAEQAEVDAQLAEAKARTAKAQNAVAQLQEGIRTLKLEIERKAKP